MCHDDYKELIVCQLVYNKHPPLCRKMVAQTWRKYEGQRQV